MMPLVKSMARKKYIYISLLPAFMLLVTFQYIPFFNAFYRSFFDWNGANRAEFVGLDNFIDLLFRNPDYLPSLGRMGVIVLVQILQGVIMSLFLATLINHVKSERTKYLYRVFVILPAVVPGIIGTLLWKNFYSTDGLINQILVFLGQAHYTTTWLGNEHTALLAILFMGFPWINGTFTLIYLAGYIGINSEIYDAANIDGVNIWSRFWKVEFPLLLPQTRLIVLLALIGSIQNYENILILTNGGPGTSTLVPGLMLFQYAFSYSQMGYACAIGILLFMIIITITIINQSWGRES